MPVLLKKPICENMRKIRLEKGLTQKQVASACGMVDATYRTYELGKANPKPATVARIAKALGVSIEEIYGIDLTESPGIQTPNVSSAIYQSILADRGGAISLDAPNQKRLLAAYNQLNEAGQHEAIKRVEELGQVPSYKSKPNFFDALTDDERDQISSFLESLQNAEVELGLMTEKGLAKEHDAMLLARRIAETSASEIGQILLKVLKRTQNIPADL